MLADPQMSSVSKVMPRGTAVPITPGVLKWAIDESGYERAEVAKAAGVDAQTLHAWIAGREQPLLTQFRKLTNFLKRQQAIFFLPRAPESHDVEPEFRHAPGVTRRQPSPGERLHVREAARLQRGVAWVRDELGETPHAFPTLPLSGDAEAAAAHARNDLAVSEEQQLAWASPWEAQKQWRAALEQRGITVLLLPMGKDAVRGFSLWHPTAPLIAVNTHWNPQARTFTMFHEWGHLLTRTSSMCAQPSRPKSLARGDQVERWCEQFAAAFLAPWDAVRRLLHRRYDWRPGQRIENLAHARYVANKLHISLRATVLRLIDNGIASWELYQAIPPAADVKQAGGAAGGRRRPQIRIDEYGVRTARTFLEAVSRDAITRDDALRYLDVADTEFNDLENLTRAG